MMLRNRLALLERSAFIATPIGPTSTVRLRTPADVRGVIEEQVNRLRADHRSSAVEKARANGAPARVALEAITADQMAARIEARRRSSLGGA